MKQQIIRLDQAERWQQIIEGIPHCVAHTHGYCFAMSQQLGQPIFLYVGYDNNNVLVCPFAVRRYRDSTDIVSIYGNGGFVGQGEFPHFQSQWAAFLKEQGFTTAYIALNQLYDWTSLFDASVLVTHKKTYWIDLNDSLDEIHQRMGRNNRRLLRRWHEQGFEYCYDQAALHQRFITLYPEFAERMGVEAAYQFTSQTLDTLQQHVAVYYNGVLESGRIVSVRCFLYTDFAVDAFLEANEPEVKQHSRALYDDGIRYFKEKGIRWLNLSGGIRAGDSLDFFKSQLSHRSRDYSVVRLVVDPEKYQLLCQSLDPASDYFPPYYQLTQEVNNDQTIST